MIPLLDFFGSNPCSFINGASCRAYVQARRSGEIGARKASNGTARRELETLSAALNFAFREGKLRYPIPVVLPKKSPARQRWLTRSELAALLLAALGYKATIFDLETGCPLKWRRSARPLYHLARFILICVYTGTRHDACVQLRWRRNRDAGWCDLERGILFRKGDGQAETNKRRPPSPIPDRLMPHLKRWRKLTAIGPTEYESQLIAKQRRAWHVARRRAGLDKSVTPHVLRHTCATWLLQKRITTWEVAGFLGTSEKVIRDTYGHHSPDFLNNAKRAFSK